jgi:hypothetical protein
LSDEEDSQSLRLYRQGVILTIILAVAKYEQDLRNWHKQWRGCAAPSA